MAKYTEEGADYVENVQRLLRKFETAKSLVPAPVIRSAAQPTRIGVIFYGSTTAAMEEALEALARDGIALDTCRIRAFPFAESIVDFVLAHDRVFVVEQNRDAQLRALLVNECALDPARLLPILHYDGTPITARFITEAIAPPMARHQRHHPPGRRGMIWGQVGRSGIVGRLGLARRQLGAVVYRQNGQGIGVVRLDPVDEDVWQAGNDEFPGSGQRALVAKVRKARQKLCRLPNALSHGARGGRAALSEIGRDCPELLQRTRSIAKPHRLKDFQTSSISSSVANSPRSASAIASLTSSSCSGESRYSGSEVLAISSNRAPATSWRSSGSASTAWIPRLNSFVIAVLIQLHRRAATIAATASRFHKRALFADITP